MLKNSFIILFLTASLLTSACSDKLFKCKAGTEVILKDSKVLNIRVEFGFTDKDSMMEFMSKKKEIMFAIRLTLRQHESSRLKGMGRRNVLNAIKNICKQLLDKDVKQISIIKYIFSEKNRRKGNKFPGPVDIRTHNG